MRMITLALVALVVTGSGNAGAEPAVSRLRIVSDQPLVVLGVSFRPYERVRLFVGAPGPLSRTVRAGRLGRFRMTLELGVPRCGGVVIQAVGARGSRAMVDRTGPDCAPID